MVERNNARKTHALNRDGYRAKSTPNKMKMGGSRHRVIVDECRDTTHLEKRKHPSMRSQTRNESLAKARIRASQKNKNPKYCTDCHKPMEYVGIEVEHDERYIGDGDYEMGSSAYKLWKCPKCHNSYSEDMGFKGTGQLR